MGSTFLRALVALPLVLACFVAGEATAAPDRVALVVGNGQYAHATSLPNPPNDARDAAAAFRELGFDVIDAIDVDKAGFDRRLRDFARALRQAKTAVFFYAGHGMQVAGKNYAVPVDARLETSADLAVETVDIDQILSVMQSDETRTNLVFLDACRDNPLSRSFARALPATRSGAVGSGLSALDAGRGTMIAFATAPNKVAMDGDGRNSPFTVSLLKHIRTPGLDIAFVMRRVTADVEAASRGTQIPWIHASLTKDVVLVPAAAAQQGAATTVPPVVPVPAKPAPAVEVAVARPVDPQPSGPDPAAACDRAAGALGDPDLPKGVSGISLASMRAMPRPAMVAAQAVCEAAMARHPTIGRFVYQAGRIADGQLDLAKAQQLYERAVALGSVGALNSIGINYLNGEALPKNPGLARDYFDRAVALGHMHALLNIGGIYDEAKDYAEARRWYEKAAAAGVVEATTSLGVLHLRTKEPAKAYAMFRKAAEQGDARAMFGLGESYRYGFGVAKNNAEARRWYERSAAGGYAKAEAELHKLR